VAAKDNSEKKDLKSKKAPGLFRKPMTEKQLEKKILRYIEQPEDRSFIRSCYEEGEGIFRLREGLDEGAVKRLAGLAKPVKENRKGPVKLLPLGIAVLVLAGAGGFFLIFANPLLEQALEKGLEAVFEARAEAEQFKLNLLKFEVSLDSLAVANRERPMTNLFEFGRMTIRLKPQAVMRGKIYIEEIRTDNIRFGTERKYSGTLPEKPPKKKPPRMELDIPPLFDLENFDAMALLNREYDKLQTPKLYDTAIGAYNTAADKWRGQVTSAKARGEDLINKGNGLIRDAQSLQNISMKNAQEIQAGAAKITRTVADINTMVNTVQDTADEVQGMVTSIQDDIRTAIQLEQQARNAIAADLNHLKSYVNLSGGAAMEALEPLIREVLSDTAEQYLDYGLIALEALEKLKAMQASTPKTAKPPKEEKVKFRGRDVIFPTWDYPRFYLGILAADFTIREWHYGFDLRGVSSDPDKSGAPTRLALSLAETGSYGREINFKGGADLRSNAAERFEADIRGSGFPFALGNRWSRAGIGDFTGSTSFTLDLRGNTDGSAAGSGSVSLVQARLIDPANTVTQAVAEALQGLKSLDLGITYEHFIGVDDKFSVTTNIGALLADALRRTAAAYAQKAAAELEKLLRDRISSYIDGKFLSKEELDTLFQAVRGDKAALDQLKNTLSSKRTELENKARQAGEAALEDVKRQAESAAQQAVQDALQGKTPSVPAPSLPKVPSLPRLPGR
jgi:uncharacterized protein (TIGR03545 family)